MPYDFTTPPRSFADPTDDKHLTRRSWVLGIRDALSDLCEKVANKDQPGGYPGLDSAGRIAVADMPAVIAQARHIANQTISTASTWTQVALATEDFDDDGMHSTSTNTGRFVATRAGLYRCSAAVLWNTGQSTTSPRRDIRLTSNGTSAINGCLVSGNYTGGYFQLVIPALFVQLAVGQYVELQAWSALASAVLYGANDAGPAMTAQLVRAG